ncbi:MAG: PQQ-binding-like beta-propeller repeat protein [Ktedonobacteraceae bacterium]
MKYFFKSKLLHLWLFLFALSMVVSLAVTGIHAQATHAAVPSNLSRVYRSAQTTNHSSAKFDSSTPDWPEFHGDAARDGSQPSNTFFSKANASSLTPVSGFAPTSTAMSSPAIYQGIAYYTSNMPVTNGATQKLDVSTIYGVDALTGQVLWSEQTPACGTGVYAKPEYIVSSPAVTTGLVNGVATTEVFIGRGANKEARGCIYDFNGLDGTLIWKYTTANQVNSSPAIMATNNGTLVVVGDNNVYVHAFSVNYNGSLGGNGIQVWSYNNSNDPPPPGYAQYCLPAPTLCGDAVWSSPAEGLVMVNGTPHHYAYFSVGAEANTVGRIDAIDMDNLVNNSPTLPWSFWDIHPQYDNDFGDIVALTDANGFAIRVYSGTNNGDMYGVDAITGSLYFDFNIPAYLGNAKDRIHSTGALLTIGGTTELIFGSGGSKEKLGPNNGHIWALDALSTNPVGTVLWKSQDFGSDIESSPVILNQDANAVGFIAGPWTKKTAARGDLLAFDPATGAILADYQVFNHLYGTVSSVAVYGGRVYVTEGYLLYGNTIAGGGLASFQCAGCL